MHRESSSKVWNTSQYGVSTMKGSGPLLRRDGEDDGSRYRFLLRHGLLRILLNKLELLKMGSEVFSCLLAFVICHLMLL
jgi:hypothetical protein